ncbi:hypothetical protein FHP25_23370 [Vineibacter terrae]|uniref:Uncharacterized protein n=1 Tax=Vineibacter terrae TaxID=2586908 RepID=A0A5C8PGH1_9HYPH|nr:hypothetical protein [Vineibacter terrae]TXL72923.1 hypothetical protein FHP25_23370 [Vineibacter terrae]
MLEVKRIVIVGCCPLPEAENKSVRRFLDSLLPAGALRIFSASQRVPAAGANGRFRGPRRKGRCRRRASETGVPPVAAVKQRFVSRTDVTS